MLVCKDCVFYSETMKYCERWNVHAEWFNPACTEHMTGMIEGDSWRLNSGIVDVKEDEKFFFFHGSSGSVYNCYKHGYGVAGAYNKSVLSSFLEKVEGVEVMPEATDWSELIET